MRLHRLDISAFGPFAGTETVDFDALTEAGLFLLHGQTGAGKTSVLDAVCFALYGVVPGARQQGGHLRSDHAAPDVRPEVVIDVSVAGRRLEITRSPAWERPKRRGTGTTTEAARTLVREWRAGEWVELTSRSDEAAQLVGSVTGMNASQFTQVVMLPQGRFAEFLRADAEARRVILEQLFATRRFSDVEGWLADQRRVLDRAVAAVEQTISELLARVAEVTGSELPTADTAPAAWLEGLAAAARELGGQRHEATERSRATLREAEDACQAAERVVALQARHADALVDVAGLDADEPEHQSRLAELAAARRAAAVAGHLDTVLRATRRRDGAVTRTEGVVATVRRLLPDVEIEPVPLRLAAKGLREEAGRFTELAREADELSRVRADLQLTRAGLADETHQLVAADALLAGADEHRTVLQRELAILRETAAGIEPAELTSSALQRQLAAARELCRLQPLHTAAADRVRETIDLAQAAREQWLALRAARLAGMAAELAEGLADGSPCPVCGGLDHPRPASPAAEVVRSQDEELARAQVDAADGVRARAQDDLASIAETMAAATVLARGDDNAVPEVAELLDQVTAVGTVLQQAREALARLPVAQRTLDDLDAEVESTRTVREELLATAATRQARLATLEQREAEIDSVLTTALGPGADPLERAAEVTQCADAAHEAAELLERRADAQAELEAATAELAAAAVRAGFTDGSAAADAVRDDATLATLELRCRDHDDARARVRAILDDPDIVAATQVARPNLAPLHQRRDDCARAHEEAVGQLDAVTRRETALARLSIELSTATAESAPARERARLVGDLSRLAEGTGGGNTLRMRLSSFVLAARLEAVAEAASVRLLAMSGGRYTLVHSDDAGGRGRAGLGLQVIDAWTGAARHPSTLSGGESFFASLALALGLADVVAHEAGGAMIETLFVDEGFGSLDEETLDEVMDTLDALRDGGRAVGLVSHVADLRQRVPAQLHVVKGRAGSHLRQSS